MPLRLVWDANPGEGGDTPEPDPVELVDDADLNEFDGIEADIDDLGNEIHEDLDEDLDEDLEADITNDPSLGHLERWEDGQDEDEDEDEDEDDAESASRFYANTAFPVQSFGLHGRFGDLRGDDDDDDDDDDANDDDEDEDEDEDEDAGVSAGIQGLLDIHRQLRNLPTEGNVDEEDIRRHPLMNALRGVFPMGSTGLGRLDVLDPRLGRIMAMLKSSDDADVMRALRELSQYLLLRSNELMSLATFPVESIARLLVQLMQRSENIEILVLTAREMANLVDNGFTGAVRALINAGVVPVMRQRFENLEYIDLLEHLIRVAKPVASVEPKLVLESGCLLPCLNIMEFFNTYIQKNILGAVDACAHAVSESNIGMARELLAALPSPPSELSVGTLCQLVSAIAKRSPADTDFRDVISYNMWGTLLSYVSSQTPQLARVLRACSHVVARCPDYVRSRAAIAMLVTVALTEGSRDSFSAFLATPKETLFSGLKLLQVLLPPPPAIGPFVGPYRRVPSYSDVQVSPREVHDFALGAVKTAIAIHGASTNTPVRQLALLVIVQTLAAKPAGFSKLVRELQLAPFAAQVVAEGADNMALNVGGLDLAWDLANNPETLVELSATGITADLEDLSGNAQPEGTYSATDNLKPVIEYMASRILEHLRTQQVVGDYSELLEHVRAGLIDVDELAAAPLPELLRAGLLDALKHAGEKTLRTHLSSKLVSILQGAVGRLERFQLQLTPSHSSSELASVLGRFVKIRITERSNPHNGWALKVPAVASLAAVEDFVRDRFAARRIIESGRDYDHVAFYVGGERLPADISVLKAVHGQLNHSSHDHHDIPQLQFERTAEAVPPAEQPEPSLERHGDLGEAIRLLAILADENEIRNEPIPWSSFQNAKLTAKLTRQMADALAVAAAMWPQWTFDTVMRSPFLYPLRSRLQFVQLTSCGWLRNIRILRQMQGHDGDDDDEADGEPDDADRVLGRYKHQKYRLARDRFLEGALRLLELSCKKPAILDVMFYGEEGTGRGPTQEFFTLASRELSALNLGVWRETPTGLFPSAESSSQTNLRIFEGVGRLLARAVLDKRILDFRLNPAFFLVALDSQANLETLRRVDAQMAASLDLILKASANDVKDMGLDFVLPGTSIELIPDGANITVTAENAPNFVALVIDRVIGSGIEKQMNAFRDGFSSTIPVSALHAFTTEELVALSGAGRAEDWSEAALLDAFRADHGYSMRSVPVQSLVRVLASFDSAERRKFLMFATGSPHLPIGGFKALNPPFTVVVKHPDNDTVDNDRYLPSVMTCVNYLKLPQYSSEDVMRAQLKLAMTEGSEAFPLS